MLDILVIRSRRRKMILAVTAIFGISALIISLILPKRYTANAIVLPPQQNSSVSALWCEAPPDSEGRVKNKATALRASLI